jgi:hypothetical protein
LRENSVHTENADEISWDGADPKNSAGCSKRPSSKAAASEDPEAYPLGYVEDLNDARTLPADFFRILLQQLAVDLDGNGRFEGLSVGHQRTLLLLKEDVLYGAVFRFGSFRRV